MSFLNDIKGQFQNKSIRQLVANFRTEYLSDGIDEVNMSDDPIFQFEIWFNEAVKNKIPEPNIMHLSTVSADCKPSGRVLLLKGFDEKGFVFYTNYDSRKGSELINNSNASMTFLWFELYRQVRIEGVAEKISGDESDKYFHSRPRGSQISAVASSQSSVIKSREELEKKVLELNKEFENKPVPRPENWGGYCLNPVSIEFWQGRASRLHDRILYTLNDKVWTKKRLAP
ncbi:MAG TPA: pyridoxamine 5'-phosphate oxidase [Ignavibacteria bacterium]|nr:pyridoxamine 5'-phosphate oxidase [Ignavibacteria bacterium]